jgi:hypothetical protein
MNKQCDLSRLDQTLKDLNKNASKDLSRKDVVPFSEELISSGAFKKIAFDLYRADNDLYANLWTMEDVDGAPHLVRAADPQYESNSNEDGSWIVTSNYDKDNITLAYKNIPIARFSSDEFKFSPDEIVTFKMALIDRLKNDGEFIKTLLLEQPQSKRSALVTTFPEFSKLIKE